MQTNKKCATLTLEFDEATMLITGWVINMLTLRARARATYVYGRTKFPSIDFEDIKAIVKITERRVSRERYNERIHAQGVMRTMVANTCQRHVRRHVAFCISTKPHRRWWCDQWTGAHLCVLILMTLIKPWRIPFPAKGQDKMNVLVGRSRYAHCDRQGGNRRVYHALMTFYIAYDRFETSMTLSHNRRPSIRWPRPIGSASRSADATCSFNVHRARVIVFGESKCIFLRSCGWWIFQNQRH